MISRLLFRLSTFWGSVSHVESSIFLVGIVMCNGMLVQLFLCFRVLVGVLRGTLLIGFVVFLFGPVA